MKNQKGFLQGAAILTLSTIIVKVIGLFYKVPLQNIVGPSGFGYFTTAYDIYSILLMFSTTGIPVAISKLVAESVALSDERKAEAYYLVAYKLLIGIGTAGMLIMILFSKQLSFLASNTTDARYAIMVLAPAVLFMCMISAKRGFFQGKSNMMPTAISQMIEAVCKAFFGIVVSYIIMTKTKNAPLAAGGAIIGVTIGEVCAAAYMSVSKRRVTKSNPIANERSGLVLRRILLIAVPITVGSVGLQMINFFDSAIYMRRLTSVLGMSQYDADELKGIYNFGQSIFNMPCSLILPLTISLLPVLSSFYQVNDTVNVRKAEKTALKITFIIACPCAIGISFLAQPIIQLLCSNYTLENIQVSTSILRYLGIAVIFNAVVLVTNTMIQAKGNVQVPVVHMMIGGLMKLIIDYILTAQANFNIVGAAIGSLCCYLIIAILNICYLHRGSSLSRQFLLTCLKPLIAALLMGGAGCFVYFGIMSGDYSFQNCVIAIGASAMIYFILILCSHVLTKDDLEFMPVLNKKWLTKWL